MHLCKLQKITRRDRQFVVLVLEKTVCLSNINLSSITLNNTSIVCDVSKGSWRYFLFSLVASAVITMQLSIRSLMMSFVGDPMYPMKTLCRVKMYVLFTASSKIFSVSRPCYYYCRVWDRLLCYCLVVARKPP